ncbi:uncharacterized protein LOC131079459 isoform X2 [Cryptomeria japonica]|uniref:uncharacterized protein LOC131079459 isoform X2 n=1 Tax=Cryptomeria japonica TaxID=3369 RepID=UPI0025AC05E4|nr:uncharacterized protein LOC131079459 isoform X2 [Cryptomeria japonica]
MQSTKGMGKRKLPSSDKRNKEDRKRKSNNKQNSPNVPVALFDPYVDNHLRLYNADHLGAEEAASATKFKSLDQILSRITFVSNDFVLNVGGSVWALDWCPKGHQGASSQINIEYLAVGAHPPNCLLHTLGVPITGKGVVQIWSIFNANLNEKASPSKRQKVKGKRQSDKNGPVRQENGDSNSIASGLFKEPVVGQYSVLELDKVPDKNVDERTHEVDLFDQMIGKHGNEEDGIPIGIPIDCRYQETACSDSKLTSQDGRNRMKDKVQSKVDDDNAEVLLENMGRNSVSCMGIVGLNDNTRKYIRSTDRKVKSYTATPSVDDTGSFPLEESNLPRMVLCLAHEGEVAWDVKWQPSTEKDLHNQHRLGFLAVLLGDGSIEVWEVPVPSAVNMSFTSNNARGGLDPRFIKLDPVFKCSKLQSDGRQSIPLTLEWSTSTQHDLLLAGCHDGTVAVWKFNPKAFSSQDVRPLICFTADAVPIRTLGWAPNEGDTESTNIIVTGGHGGSLRFWDLRDPFRPLWDLHLSRGIITSLDWLHEPRCIILSMDDGTLRILSLCKAALDTPVTGRPFCGTQFQGLQSYYCSSFTIWSVQASRRTGLVAYCSVDGSALHFQLTKKAVEKDKMRHRSPHYTCGSLIEEGTRRFKIVSPSTLTPVPMKKSLNEWSDTPRSIRGFLSESNQVLRTNIRATTENKYIQSGSSELVAVSDEYNVTPSKNRIAKKSKKVTSGKHTTKHMKESMGDLSLVPAGAGQCHSSGVEGIGCSRIEKYPSKQVSIHKVRWNSNPGSERWLCYGGAAGIVRCQEITSVFAVQ